MIIHCPTCSIEIEVTEELIGAKGQCPACGDKFIVPRGETRREVASSKDGARETAATKSGVSKRKSEATAPVRKPATAATANRKSGGRRFHGAKNSRAGSVLMAFAAVAVCAGAVVYFLIANGGEDGAAGITGDGIEHVGDVKEQKCASREFRRSDVVVKLLESGVDWCFALDLVGAGAMMRERCVNCSCS